MKDNQQALLIAVLLLYALGAFLVGFKVGREYEKARMPDITERTDTIRVKDTLPYYYPVPKDSIVLRYVTVTVPAFQESVPEMQDNVPSLQDSVPITVPIERKVYQEDSSYYAVVTGPAVGGYHPSLDTLEVYRETVTIEKVRNVTSYKAFRWSLGPFLSQEVGLSHYAAKAGVQADLSLGGGGRWRFVPEAGYMWTSWDKGGWYAGGRLRYDLIRRR